MAALLQPGLGTARLLRASGVRSGTIEALFHRHTGQSLLEYVRRARLEIAVRLLLESDLLVADVAHLAGFSDRFHLNRAVKGWLGMPPLEIRRRGRLVAAKAGELGEDLHSRRFWNQLRRGELGKRQARKLWQFLERLYPEAFAHRVGAARIPRE